MRGRPMIKRIEAGTSTRGLENANQVRDRVGTQTYDEGRRQCPFARHKLLRDSCGCLDSDTFADSIIVHIVTNKSKTLAWDCARQDCASIRREISRETSIDGGRSKVGGDRR